MQILAVMDGLQWEKYGKTLDNKNNYPFLKMEGLIPVWDLKKKLT